MQRLTLRRCTVANGQTEVQSERFEVTVNPASVKHTLGISYTGDGPTAAALGKSAVELRFQKMQAETLAFTLTLDGTGVVPNTRKTTVARQIAALRAIVYTYDGDEHEPNVVLITWGSGLTEFYGRLTSMTLDYTLFDPDGLPLRATVALNFSAYVTSLEEAVGARRNSPDMTHMLTVRAGDTLPGMCAQVYGDPGRYPLVAAANGLDGFRQLEPGRDLRFPPLPERRR